MPRAVAAALVVMLVVSGVGAVPTLERSDDADQAGDGAALGWTSLASPTGAAVAESQPQSSTGPSCPEGMVLDEGLCKTPKTEQTDMERVCPQAAAGYVLVTVVGELGPSHTCQKTVAAYCVGGKVLHLGQCRTRTVTTTTQTAAATWSCLSGALISTSGEHGTAWSCKIAAGTSCPRGERYRGGVCEKQVTTHKHKNYTYACPSGYTLGADGIAWTCSKPVAPYCTGGQTYRTSPSRGCYRSETYYRTASYRYACASGYTLGYDGIGWTCSRTEKYRKKVCSFDPIAGRQCWWEDRTRTVTEAAARSCPSGYAANGSNCRANSASTRWAKTARSPITADTRPAARSCPSGYSPNGSTCRRSTTQWKASGSTPVTSYRYEPAGRSCRAGYSWDSASQLCAKTATTTAYSSPTAPLTALTGQPPTQRCPADGGWSPAGGGRCSRTVLGPPTRAPTGDACSEDLGSLGTGAVARSGTLAAGCESWKKGNAQSPHHARRYTLTVPSASKLDAAASSSAADVFVHVLTGSGSGAAAVASDDDSGTGTDAALSGVQLAAGTAYTVEVTTSAAAVTGAFALTITVTPDKPPVKIVGLADAYGIGQATATAGDDFAVEPAGAKCTAKPADAKIAVGRGAARTVSLARAAPFSQKVTVACTATGRSQGAAAATLRGHLAVAGLTVAGDGCAAAAGGTADYKCSIAAGGTLSLTGTAQGPSAKLSLAWTAAAGAKIDAQAQAKTQTVAPDAAPVVYSRTASATVSCTETGAVTLTAAAGAHKRTVTVDVACAAAPAVPCDDPLGALPEGDTARAGTIAAEAGCVSANRLPRAVYPYYTRRHTFTLTGPAQLTVDLGNDSANAAKLDTYLILLGGHGADGKVLARDDDGGPGADSRISRKLPAGDYTIEATSWASRRVGRYLLNVNARHDNKVTISGLAHSTESGAGAVTVAADFTVTPAAAACTASPAAATVADGADPADRTVSAEVTAPGSAAVTVTCTAAGHGAAAQTVTLTAELAAGIATIGARPLGGGECRTTAAKPDGADAAYACTMAKGASLRAQAEATATKAALAVAWTAAGGVTVASQQQRTATAVVGPDSTALHRRTAAATLTCTADGTATATAALGASTKKALLTITCLPPVQIHGLADTAATGTGQITVTRPFTVTPATAACSAAPDTAAITKGKGPADRSLSATIASPGRLSAAVTCAADGHYDAVQTVTLSAAPRCADDLGMLRPGVVTRTGTIAADTACTSKARRPASSLVHYARRHTFELARTSWVTIELESSASNSRRLDTYLVLLQGHQPAGGGKALGRNDDVGPGAGTYRTNSRLSAVKLAPGLYTIEATSYSSRRTGSYDLAVSAVTMHGLDTSMHVVAGNKTTFVFGYRPTDARITVDKHANAATTLSYAGGSGALTVTSPAAGAYTAKLNIAVPDGGSGHHPAAPIGIGGTTCAAGQAVVVGSSVCASASGYSLTITKTSGGSTATVPAGCVTDVPRGRWHLVTKAWPTSADCVVPHPNGNRPAQFFAFRVYDTTADVTIRLGAAPSPNPQDTYLELYRATGSQIVNGRDIVTVNLDTAPPSSRTNDNAGTGYRYLDGYATDSRLQQDLAPGIYVIAATVPPAPTSGTTVTAVGQFTINIKIPYPQPGS